MTCFSIVRPTLVVVFLAGPALAQSLCDSPAPDRFDSRVFGGGGATVFDMASQYQARRSGRASSGGSVFVASGNRPTTGGVTAGDLLGGLTAAASAASAIQGGGQRVGSTARAPVANSVGPGTCGQPGSEVACSGPFNTSIDTYNSRNR